MQHDAHYWPNFGRRLDAAVIQTQSQNARICRTEHGVRVDFSDGRVVRLDKDDCVTESGFMLSVEQWVRRHGARTIEIEYR